MQPVGTSPAVIMRAFIIACDGLGVSTTQAAKLLSISEEGLQQSLYIGFAEGSKETELQLAFIRLYHLLYALSDGDSRAIYEWLNRHNPHLNTTPVQIVQSMAGLIYLTDYLEDMQEGEAMPLMDLKKGMRSAYDTKVRRYAR